MCDRIDGAIVTDSIFVYAKNETVTPEPTPGDNSQNQGDAGNGGGSGSGSADGGAMTASVGDQRAGSLQWWRQWKQWKQFQ